MDTLIPTVSLKSIITSAGMFLDVCKKLEYRNKPTKGPTEIQLHFCGATLPTTTPLFSLIYNPV